MSAQVGTASTSARAIVGALGLALVVGFHGLGLTNPGLWIQFVPPWDHASTGELLGWLGHIMLVIPGGLLMGWAAAPWLGPRVRRMAEALDGADRRQLRLALAALVVLAFVLASSGRSVFLHDWPVTDDENATRFGGRLLAKGEVMTPAPAVMAWFPHLFLFMRDGMITSFDWLGGQVAWAIGEATGMGAIVFTVAASLAPALVALAAARRFSPAWGAAAALVVLTCPMAQCLSWTAHPHLLSRAAIAAAIAVVAQRERSGDRGLAFGFLCSLALLCRPFETLTLLTPLVLGELWDGHKTGELRSTLTRMVLGGFPLIVVFMLHNHAVTGQALVPARFADNEIPVAAWRRPWESLSDSELLWRRFSVNVVYNVLRVGVWFWGPLGMLLAVVGAGRDAFTKRLAGGVGCLFALGLGHDDAGIHAVGPMHQSESIVLLTLLTVSGAKRVADRLRDVELPRQSLGVAVIVMGLVGGWNFTVRQGQALRLMTTFQDDVYGWMDAQTEGPSVVLVPKSWEVWGFEPYRAVGTWVLSWRHPDPHFDDRVLVVVERAGAKAAVRKAFPNRKLYRLERDLDGVWKVRPDGG